MEIAIYMSQNINQVGTYDAESGDVFRTAVRCDLGLDSGAFPSRAAELVTGQAKWLVYTVPGNGVS